MHQAHIGDVVGHQIEKVAAEQSNGAVTKFLECAAGGDLGL